MQEQPFPTSIEIFLFHDSIHRNDMPLGYRKPQQPLASYDFSSLRDLTKDILSVAVALLFGVGCGALTAAWSFWCRISGLRNSSVKHSISN
ncbi:hypothetical protein SO802_010481 [Lithocarpus litseifolius]|uniref:Uncharacterized protein n=1 Tax=Lithocarpus litseifolius TaxID=425828 RepID=A0AAW2DHC9_9ROSI